MRKILLTALALTMTMGMSAQRWDFTKWSDETVANLKAVNPSNTEWSDIEKNTGTAPTDISKENCFWEVKAQGTDEGAELTANGVTIKETAGLLFTHTGKDRSLAIAVNYPETSIGTYNGPSYLWLGSKNINYIVIPGVKPGTEITIGVESHKNTDARGVELYVGRGNTGTKLLDPDGVAVALPTTYQEQVWLLPEGLTDTPNEDGTYDITIRNTNGCHLYFIQVGDGQEGVEEPNKIAYLYDSTNPANYDLDSDPVYGILSGTDDVVEAIDIKDFTAESTDTVAALEANYDLVVVSEGPKSGHKFATAIKGMVNRVPMLNMKSYFYKKGVFGWGAGANPNPATGTIVLTEAGAAHEAIATLGYAAGDEIELYTAPEGYTGNIIQGYTANEGGFIADDAVLATVADGINAIHEHGTVNKYMLYPLSADAVVAGVEFTEDATNLLLAIVDYLADSKSKVRQATKPAIELTYENGLTTVELVTNIDGATIYYTTDGSEPTTASAVYTEALKLTENAVVKAYIVALGYNDSEVASAEVIVKAQAAKPVITVADGENGTKVVTMTGAEGTTIHYNLADVAPTAASPAYTEPIVITRSTDISAIAVGTDMLDSEPVFAVAEIAAYPFRKDTLATVTFSANEGFTQVYTDTAGVEQTVAPNSKKYLWGEKKGWSYYYANGDSTEVNTDTRVSDFGNGWVIASSGQAMYYHADGSDAIAGGYGPATTADAGFTKGGLQWAGRKGSDPFSGYLYSNGENKFAGPFDVALWLCAGNNPVEGETESVEICTSTDGTTWTLLDTVSVVVDKMVHKVVAHYDGNESVYIRLGYAGGYKTKIMMMQVQILGVGGTSQIALPVAGDAEVVGVQIYNAAGIQQNGLQSGLNIVRKLYANGAVEVLKVMK